MQLIWLYMVTAVLQDTLLGEPGRFHPLVGFGRVAVWLESRLKRPEHAKCSRP